MFSKITAIAITTIKLLSFPPDKQHVGSAKQCIQSLREVGARMQVCEDPNTATVRLSV
jgi:hypothetical protein